MDIDLVGGLRSVELRPGEHGAAVLLRHERRPIGFWLLPLPAGATLTAEALRRLLGVEGELAVVTEALRRELTPDAPVRLPTVSVAVCTRGRPELLATCLASLERARAASPNPGNVELLVVDNAPPDDRTRQLVDTLDGVRYAVEPRPGLDFARNHALRASTGEMLAFVDDDVVVDEDWLLGLAEAVGENPDAAAVTGLVLPQELDTDAQVVFERHGGFRRGVTKLRYAGPRHAGNPLFPAGAGIFGAGCNMAFRRDVLVGLGGFDEALDTGPPLPGGGDLDIFYRVVRSGRPLVYEPRMLVFHRHRRDRRGLRRQYWTWGTGFMAFVAKTYDSDPDVQGNLRRLVRWWLGYEARELSRSLRGKSARPADMVLAELVGGAVGLAGTYGRSVRRTDRIRASVA